MFADSYLKKNNRFPLIKTAPFADCGIIVVIPCFREPDIIDTLVSLDQCDLPHQKVEVIILINHSETSTQEVAEFNRQTKTGIENWISKNSTSNISFFAVGPVELKKKWAGAGLARKTGMDEAVLRFNFFDKKDGIIVSLDADTLVDKNYLVEIESHFRLNPKNVAATISFEHQTTGLYKKHLEGILYYEKYMRYYRRAIEFTGYPYPMFTVGSAFAVTADAYVKRGGMNRRQAGEDFYFLQNLAQLGLVGEISSTKVYPSARLSDRVPFGTGPILRKWMNGEEDLTKTFDFQAFSDLKLFFDKKENFFQINESDFLKLTSELPEPVGQFLQLDNFWLEVSDLNKNCSNIKTFQNRFFHKFNAFKILKFLNFVHENYYQKADLEKQISILKNLTKK